MTKTFSLVATGLAFLTSAPVFAEGEGAPAAQGGGMMQTFIMIAVALVFFYFILWRPEQKRRKQMEQVRSSLKKGDRVTAMGIVGHVFKIQEATVIVSLYDGAKMEIMKAAITDVQPGTEEKIVEPTDVR